MVNFLAVHFGNGSGNWGHVKRIYRRSANSKWTWHRVTNSFGEFSTWYIANWTIIKGADKLGSHRKYESFDPAKARNTLQIIERFIDWSGENRSPQGKVNEQIQIQMQPQYDLFDVLYKSMNSITRFGRLAKFDYLCSLGKLGLIDAEPRSAYLGEATGPKDGIYDLFHLPYNRQNKNGIDKYVNELSVILDIPYAMQVIEDALCNWQKNHNIYMRYNH
ncbi:MAG: hypothetical protein AAF620_06620 [Bacteroidota bacterium]